MAQDWLPNQTKLSISECASPLYKSRSEYCLRILIISLDIALSSSIDRGTSLSGLKELFVLQAEMCLYIFS
ncbi:hypothetical protein FGO68_gene5112 [Halteria grandinella]|uniref:Uncharacterized protein n=1 Tax=Halteria grandinella TaxID=5974 RepID=A0A8J8NLF7_HALGN|nr:hypothetical protein FGO68_gene5112 [Halteria grandinella]